jgi:hypothetical protein
LPYSWPGSGECSLDGRFGTNYLAASIPCAPKPPANPSRLCEDPQETSGTFVCFNQHLITVAVAEGINRVIMIVKNSGSGYKTLQVFTDLIFPDYWRFEYS